jgi:UDP-N-acetylglucosamine 3-dehydrogenase
MTVHRIGLIGCGWVAPFHLAGLAKLGSRVQIVWAADPNVERAEAIARQVGAQALSDYRQGLQLVDCVLVVVPHHLHHPVALDCLNAGCHVFLEKPIAPTLEQADEIIAAAEQAGKTLMVGYLHRYRKSMRVFKQVLESEGYGRVFMLDGSMDSSLHGYALDWITKRETLGGGVLFSSSPHMLDVMLWIAGEVQTISMVGTRAAIEMEGEDTAACIMRFKNGVIGITRETWASPKSRLWYTMHALRQKAHVTLTLTPLGDLVTEGAQCPWSTRIVALGEKEEVLLQSQEGLDFSPELEHFFDCIETGRRPETDGYCARKLVALVLDAYRKAELEGGNV